MGKNWRANLGTSCKMAGGVGEEEICKAKIKLIFKGASSDIFINDFMSLDMKGMGLKLKNGILKVKEEKEDLGVLSFQSGTFQGCIYELEKEHKAGQYILELSNDKEKESLFFLKDAYVACSMSEDKEKLLDTLNFIGITPKLFSSKYIVDDYINIIIELGLNIRINCEMEGASEAIIYKKDNEKESLIVPLNYKSGYYAKDFLAYPKKVIVRSGNGFQKFFSTSDGSIGFKAVNYRKNIYTGNKNHVLQGGNLNPDPILGLILELDSYILNDDRYKNLMVVPFTTGVEKEFYHAEFIENKVFVMLESDGKQYLFNEQSIFAFIDDKSVKTLKDLKISEEKKIYHIDHKSIQLILLHLKFDGKKLEYKDVIIDSTKFDDKGMPKP